MNKFIIFTLLVMLVPNIGGWSARGDQPTAVIREKLLGRWQTQAGLLLTLKAEGTFLVQPPAASGRGPISGTWRLSEHKIEFQNAATAAVCPEVPGRYRWAESMPGTIEFTLIADACRSRKQHLAGSFHKVTTD